MKHSSFIGIDTDSQGFQCVLTGIDKEKKEIKYFQMVQEELNKFKSWVESKDNPVIALEGKNGFNIQIERFLRKYGIQFYSFNPKKVAEAKDIFIGQHKTNIKDAEACAHLALTVFLNGDLEKYRRIWFAEDGLRDLTRFYQYLNKLLVFHENLLWKEIRKSSVPLYLFLQGKSEESPYKEPSLTKGIISLLIEQPDITTWQDLTDPEITAVIGTHARYKMPGFIDHLRHISKNTQETDEVNMMLLKNYSMQVLLYMDQKRDAMNLLKSKSNGNPEIEQLMKTNGFGIVISTGIVSEIIDIRRFADNNKLASYCGLGRKLHSTGSNQREKKYSNYNRRLKNTFMTAAGSYVKYNPGSHLSGYYRNLRKDGMKPTEAKKRVARALVRFVFKELKLLKEQKNGDKDTAIDNCQNGQSPSNVPIISISNYITQKEENKMIIKENYQLKT